MVRRVIVSVQHRISKRPVGIAHVDLRPKAVWLSIFLALEQLLEELEILFRRRVAILGVLHFHALIAHHLHGRRIHVGLPLADQLSRVVLDLVEEVRRVADHVGNDLQLLEVLEDVFLELLLLLAGVRVIKPHQQLAFVSPRVVVVEHDGLHVSQVHVATGLRRKSSHHLPLHGSLQRRASSLVHVLSSFLPAFASLAALFRRHG
mmetsp:Transcript_19505/g.73783  ORF Transcript_19505/g.73783 Transcript_19505/m.73783 type:complete len:205 (+) Transcript_19505:441-1055(+)